MAKYTVDYACGHGKFEEVLFGPHAARESRLEWLADNKVCPDCYKAKMVAADAAAKKTASIKLVPAAEPVLAIEVLGQIEENKEALYALGFRWADQTNGLMGYFSMSRAKRVLALAKTVTSVDESAAWISATQAALTDLGYTMVDSLSALDLAYIAKLLGDRQAAVDTKGAAKTRLAEILAADPRPANAPLRQRIAALEKSSGSPWNGKMYGKKGYYNFYVNDKKYSATDAEVAERETVIAAMTAWDAKYAAEIAAAK